MKLSEAISLGSMLTPQSVGSFVDEDGGRCAWASAFDAAGHATTTYMSEKWKWTRRLVNCPLCKRAAPVAHAIAHLNEAHRWSRQQIAEWSASIVLRRIQECGNLYPPWISMSYLWELTL